MSDQDIRYLQELATPVAAHDTVVILPAMAGGALAGGRPADPAGGDLAGGA